MYLYILRCADSSLYTGIASDIVKRIRQHTGSLKGGAKYTKSHPPKRLEALWLVRSDDARKLECRVKSLRRAQKEELILSPEKLPLFCGGIGYRDIAGVREYNRLFIEQET